MAFKLNNGVSMPAIGLGTWNAEKGLVGDAVKEALKAGYRHIDCASAYNNQQEIGEALLEVFRAGIVKREDVWITSKLRNAEHDNVFEALKTTLHDLQLEYLDLYLIHWPVHLKNPVKSWTFTPESFAPLNIPGTWREMEKLVDSGLARSIGVSNFSSKKLEDLLKVARIPPAVNQVECSPVWQQPELREFCKSKGIHVSAYSPLGSTGASVLDNEVVKRVAEKLGKTPAQVALRWGIQAGNSVLPKSTNSGRLSSNLQIFDFTIPEEDFSSFSTIPQKRVITGNVFVVQGGPYNTVEELWDE